MDNLESMDNLDPTVLAQLEPQVIRDMVVPETTGAVLVFTILNPGFWVKQVVWVKLV
jgi:hypothetical protein